MALPATLNLTPMTLINSIRRLPRLFFRLVAPAQLLASPSDLNTTVCRERARADRSGGEFSIVTFTSNAQSAESKALRQIAKHLSGRARIIDQFGWTENGRLWLLLPNCPADAGATIAREICEVVLKGHEEVSHELYYYAAGSEDKRKKGNCQNLPPHCNSDEQNDRTHGAKGLSEQSEQAHQAVEPFVVRAMPFSKRALDVIMAASALAALAPALAIVSILIKLTSHGPVFFSQLRAGRGGKPFRMYKFRTMVVDAERLRSELLAQNEQDGPAFKIKNDPRITRVGRMLRATGTDELPQLLNVLRGEMSFVGPRPLPIAEAANCADWQQERLDITPGLTCWWQVSDRWTNIPFAEWMRMDIRYARRRSLATDFKLILRTIAFVIRRKGT
jgi:lipopolysaccharide/colanic/teichoic acid biosynthesis glycosyltransferase